MTPLTDGAKNAIDAASVTTVAATLAGWLPAVAALLTVVWTGIRIYETRTVQEWLGRKPEPSSDED